MRQTGGYTTGACHMVIAPGQRGNLGFFGFPPVRAAVLTPVLSGVTRQLCCAAYLDPAFANQVIAEVVEDEHRAVPPSLDFDLNPVVRHCYRARRLLLARDISVTVLLL